MKITPLKSWIKNLKHPLVIAGPCSAESKEQVLNIAKELSNLNNMVPIFRAGIWKPRTRPNCFEGVGAIGLPWLREVKKKYGLLTAIEVANKSHVKLALENDIDILWIGARTSANPFAVQEIADSLKGIDIPVMVKNPINLDLQLWIGALERINGAGITKLAAIHRGFSTGIKSKYRNNPYWRIPMELKMLYPKLPVICDPSHITGNRELIKDVSQKALDIDLDGLMIETHNEPDKAWSDSAQQITPSSLKDILDSLLLKKEYSSDNIVSENLSDLRNQIDRIDQEIIDSFLIREKIVTKIGHEKIQQKLTALQKHRLDKMITSRMEKAKEIGIDENFIKEIYSIIHERSIKIQTSMMNNHN